MKDYIHDLSEQIAPNLKLFAIILYSFGFVRFLLYYSWYGIDIIHFISLTEILLYTLKEFLRISIFFIGTLFAGTGILILVRFIFRVKYYYSFSLLKEHYKEKKDNVGAFTAIEAMDLFFSWIGAIFVLFGLFEFGVIREDTAYLSAMALFLLTLLVPPYEEKHIVFFSVLLALLIIAGIRGRFDAELGKREDREVSFYYEGKSFDTRGGSEYRFIGETTNNIFFYKNQDSITLIFDKNSIKHYISYPDHTYFIY